VNVSQFRRSHFVNVQSTHAVSFPAILGDNCITEVSAFGQKGTFGFFYVPPEFYYTERRTLHDYILTLDPANLYQQRDPDETDLEIGLPDLIRQILSELGENDNVEIIRCPDTGDVTFNVIVNNSGGGGSSGDCCCCRELRAIANAIRETPQGFGGMLTSLFVPREDFLTERFEQMQADLFEKMPFFGQMNDLMEELHLQFNTSGTPPEFPVVIFGQTVNIIDFSMFDIVRELVHVLILFWAYVFFIRRTMRKLPSAIGGVK
jgi:hypothetical protein